MSVPNTDDVAFIWLDYALFFTMLGLSTLIGTYFGFCTRQDSTNEYLMGGKSMRIFPIAASLIGSYISGITFLAVPADVYRFGIGYFFIILPYFIIFLTISYIYMPVFFKLQLVSSYEYLSLRFDRRIRLLSSFLNTVNTLLYLPVVVYVPALALAYATQIDIYILIPILCIGSIFYTTIGGLKAVVWADSMQFIVLIGSMIAFLCIGMKSIGGLEKVWTISKEGGRLDINWSIDPTKKDTFVSVFIGTLCSSTTILISQSFMQKYLALPKISSARKSIALMFVGLAIILSYATLAGLMIYTQYSNCDPLATGKIKKHDQIFPYYVLHIARNIPGMAGLFLSGIFSTTLSTFSSYLNSLSGTIYEDFLSPFLPADISQKRISDIMKVLVVITGLICLVVAFAIEHMGAIVPVQASLDGLTNGPLLGLFTLGMLFPSANAKGALFGGLSAIAIMSFVIGGSQISRLSGQWSYPAKTISISGCSNETFHANFTNLYLNEATNDNYVNPIFKISYFYYCFLGASLTIVIGLLISYLTRSKDSKVNKDCISPISHWMIKTQSRCETEYYDIDNALKIVKSPT